MITRDLFRLPFGNHKLTDGIYTFLLQKENSDYLRKTTYSIRQYDSLSGGSVTFYEDIDDVFDNTSRYKQKVLKYRVFITGMSFGGRDDLWNVLYNLKYVPKSSYKEWLKKVEGIMSIQIEKQMCGVGENIT